MVSVSSMYNYCGVGGGGVMKNQYKCNDCGLVFVINDGDNDRCPCCDGEKTVFEMSSLDIMVEGLK